MADQMEQITEGASPFAAGAVALVTGANSGIGYVIAEQLLAHGITVWLGARSMERGRRAAEALGESAHAVRLSGVQS